jgi:hypothetical protein
MTGNQTSSLIMLAQYDVKKQINLDFPPQLFYDFRSSLSFGTAVYFLFSPMKQARESCRPTASRWAFHTLWLQVEHAYEQVTTWQRSKGASKALNEVGVIEKP